MGNFFFCDSRGQGASFNFGLINAQCGDHTKKLRRYTIPLFRDPELSGTSGTISIIDYETNLDISWTIESTCGSRGVRLFSELFQLETDYDWIFIGGRNYTADFPIDQTFPDIIGIHFHSDYTYSASGFIIHWNCIDNLSSRCGEICDESGELLILLYIPLWPIGKDLVRYR